MTIKELKDTLHEIALYFAECWGHAAEGSEAEEKFKRYVKAVDEAANYLPGKEDA